MLLTELAHGRQYPLRGRSAEPATHADHHGQPAAGHADAPERAAADRGRHRPGAPLPQTEPALRIRRGNETTSRV